VRIHRQWLIFGGASLAFLLGSSAMGVSAIESASKGPAFDLSATCLRVNAEARQQLGVITGFGLAVSGPVVNNTDGTGHANIDFDVIGAWRTGHANLQFVESGGRWWWSGHGRLTVAGQTFPLDLESVHTLQRPGRYSRLCEPQISTTGFRPS
jgi:hypothetical protein